jgi:hypothetical protein
MAAVALSVFRSRVLPNVIEAPDILIDQAVLDTCIEFCEKTNIIKETSTEQTLTVGQFEVEIDVSLGNKVVQVQRLWVNGSEVFPASEDEVGALSFSQNVSGGTVPLAMPRMFVETSPGLVTLYPRPDAAYKLISRTAVKPSRAATAVDEVLFENWGNYIVHGALANLYMMKSKWQDPVRSGAEMAMFRQGIGNAILESRRGRSRAEDVVTPVHI